jgi:20S proteasome alpha/beta subunit
LTCIIGAKGEKGVILISDRLVVRGNEISFEDKIHVFWQGNPIVAIAFSGLTGIRDKFSKYTSTALIEARVQNLMEVIEGLENTVQALHERYSPRVASGGEVIVEAIVTGLSGLKNGNAELYHLFQQGYAEEEHKFCCIGSAGPFASAFLKLVYEENMQLEKLLATSGFVIRLIEAMGIDRNVGGGLEAIVVKDGEGIQVLPNQKIEELMKKTEKEHILKTTSEVFKNLIDREIGT